MKEDHRRTSTNMDIKKYALFIIYVEDKVTGTYNEQVSNDLLQKHAMSSNQLDV